MTYIDFISLMENDAKGKELFRQYRYAREVVAQAIDNLPHITFTGRLESETLESVKEVFQLCWDDLKKFATSYGLNAIEFRKLTAYLEK